jgi:uncharacterized membrane protein YccC
VLLVFDVVDIIVDVVVGAESSYFIFPLVAFRSLPLATNQTP